MNTLITVGNILLILGTIPAVGSVIVFAPVMSLRAPWAIHLMAYMAAVAIPLFLGCIGLVFDIHEMWFLWLQTSAFGIVVIVLWWRLVLLILARREGSPDKGGPADRPPPEQ